MFRFLESCNNNNLLLRLRTKNAANAATIKAAAAVPATAYTAGDLVGIKDVGIKDGGGDGGSGHVRSIKSSGFSSSNPRQKGMPNGFGVGDVTLHNGPTTIFSNSRVASENCSI